MVSRYQPTMSGSKHSFSAVFQHLATVRDPLYNCSALSLHHTRSISLSETNHFLSLSLPGPPQNQPFPRFIWLRFPVIKPTSALGLPPVKSFETCCLAKRNQECRARRVDTTSDLTDALRTPDGKPPGNRPPLGQCHLRENHLRLLLQTGCRWMKASLHASRNHN